MSKTTHRYGALIDDTVIFRHNRTKTATSGGTMPEQGFLVTKVVDNRGC